MDNFLMYLGGFTAGIGTVMEVIKKAFKPSEIWFKPIAIILSIAGSAVATYLHGWSLDYFLYGSVFLSCAQFGWDFLAVKPIAKKIIPVIKDLLGKIFK